MLKASFSAHDPKQTWNGAANQAERGERAFTSDSCILPSVISGPIWENQFSLQAHRRTKFARALNG